ncbi:type I glyceraldehyde-3-phosphate dehydrogenase [Cohnella herbarum]|uniref:Glyceraldehyde-3-phosphate dehydrogenase n=1 Tax=Cohnella herbarum TaxID=2728023 RepID=A0A7Z2VRK8_9BACL|nr:type I glyceraldehyde-3-phosphate dehydrogenase [Cohnella herbarum]QJD87645.1 type I glyceraldehyde-3-phosphate dehydrogenase [Cohnella herbarum]
MSILRVGLSGTGRIGRLLLRKVFSTEQSAVEVGVINSLSSPETIAHLLKYDSVHGKWDGEAEVDGNDLILNGRRVAVTSQAAPELLPWREYEVEMAIDATGKFNDRDGASRHLKAGAEKVLITAPGSGVDLTVVMGVNDSQYDPRKHRIISAASCTTNCLAPVLHVVDKAFGVEQGWMTTIHSYTNDQNHLDNSHKDLRRARACTSSIIPTSTGVGKALKEVIPHLSSVIEGISMRVPTQNVSMLDLSLQLKRKATLNEVREVFLEAVSGPQTKVMEYNELPLVSTDYIGNEKSAIIDGLSTMVRGDQLKLFAWYDNEWAYASRVYDLAMHVSNAHHSLETRSVVSV